MKNQILGLLAVGLLAGSITANAVSMIEIDANGTIVTVADNGAGDINPLEGVIGVSQSIGSWMVVSTLSISHPALGSPNEPYLDLGFSGLLGRGTIQITLIEDGFILVGPALATSAVGGTVSSSTGSSASFSTLLNGAVVSSAGPFGSGAFSNTDNFSFDLPLTPYSMGLRLTVTHDTFGNTTGNYQFEGVNVPEPGPLALFGVGLAGLALRRRRTATGPV